jgi:divalent metal cation (Fe/Co/Zn/Cd) transporter
LSVAVLLGLAMNSLWGWAWADSIASPVVAGFAIRECIEAWRGDTSATPIGMLLDEDAEEHDDH